MIQAQGSDRLFLFAIVGVALGVALIGGVITYVLRLPIESAVQEEAIHDITAVAQPRILKLVTPQDLAQPIIGARYEELDRLVKEYVLGNRIARLKLWDASRTVVYSTLSSEVGKSYPGDKNLQRAFQGSTTWEVTSESESPEERTLGELIEAYVPLTWEGTAKGVLEVYIPYAPYARHLASIRNAILAAVVGMSLTLPISLYVLYRIGVRSIRRERDTAIQRQREVQGLNRLLQQDLAHYSELRGRLLELRDKLVPQLPPPFLESASIPAREALLATQITELADFATDLRVASTVKEQQPEN